MNANFATPEPTMKRLSVVLAAAVALVLAACGEGTIDPSDDADFDADYEAIVNGTVDSGHPSVGKIREYSDDICTGTLIGAKTVLTAAHCISGTSASKYKFVLGGSVYQASSVKVHPGWDGDADQYEGINDLAVILLTTAPSVKPTPIAVSPAKVGENLTLVGFGVTGENYNNYGTKRITYNSIQDVNTTKIYWMPANGVGTTCYGDSGGPAFAVRGGVEVQVGITSGGEAPCETGYSWDTRVDAFVSWIKSVANNDVVLEGSSDTTPVPTTPDTKKPVVRITSPSSNAKVTANTTITVKASITDNVGVVRGELFVDGALVTSDASSPYTFSTKLTKGQHQLRVFGYDAAGNAGRYTIYVTAR